MLDAISGRTLSFHYETRLSNYYIDEFERVHATHNNGLLWWIIDEVKTKHILTGISANIFVKSGEVNQQNPHQ